LNQNKLFCTFSLYEDLDNIINILITHYTVLYSKIFVLELSSTNEYVCTYNIDTGNMSSEVILPNIMSIHRKKDSNSLYSLNGLNALIKKLNNGVINNNYPINWPDYKNSIILSNKGELNISKTIVKKIINI